MMITLSIRQKLLIASAFVLLLLLSFFASINYFDNKKSIINNSNAKISEKAQNLQEYIGNWVYTNELVLSSIADAIERGNPVSDTLIQGHKAGAFMAAYYGDERGMMTIIPDDPLPADYDPRKRGWYQSAKKANHSIITAPYVDAVTGKVVVTFALPTRNGVVGADIAMEKITSEILNINLGETGRAMLVDGQGSILIAEDKSLLNQKVNSLISQGKLSQTVTDIVFNSKSQLAVQLPVANSDWFVVTKIEREEALAALASFTLRIIISTVVIISISVLIMGVTISVLLRPLKTVSQAMADISQGDADLTQRLTMHQQDEVGQLSLSFNTFVESIHKMVIDVVDTSNDLNEISIQSRDSAATNNDSVQKQQHEISQVAAAIHEMTSTSAAVAENAKATAESAEAAQSESRSSEQHAKENQKRMLSLTNEIEQTTTVINQLNDHAQKINSILATIQGIAEQTNLLALNAAIEAARAGEQGRGFAVVADEVRALSQRTHEATGEIQGMIEALRSQTSAAVDQMVKSKTIVENTMDTAQMVSESQASIRTAINTINEQALTIAEASREQNQATEEINRITHAIQDESQRLASNVESAFQTAEQLQELGNKIQENLARFHT